MVVLGESDWVDGVLELTSWGGRYNPVNPGLHGDCGTPPGYTGIS